MAPNFPNTTASTEPDPARPDDVDIDMELRQRVVTLHERLDKLDHYELLGVDRSADKKAIKRAYFELAATFHPDRYFRKKLGSFKLLMEAIFMRVTVAHDTLVSKERRAEYDDYVEERRRSRGIEELLEAALAEAKRAEESVERQFESLEVAVPPATSTPAAAAPTVDVAARRDALARRLLGGRIRTSASSPPPTTLGTPAVSSALSPADAMDALRRRYQDRVAQAKAVEARKYAAKAEAALASGDAIAAASALRVANSLAPTDAELERKNREAQEKADALLCDTYERQATYEEKQGRWMEAARSWARVCRSRSSDARAHERAANALVKAAGDTHEAVRLAQRACELDPKNGAYRVTLAKAYLAADLTLNARRELERAAQIAPYDDTIHEMLKRVEALA